MTKNILTTILMLLTLGISTGISVKAYGQYSTFPIFNDDCEKISPVIYEGNLVVAADQTAYLVVSENLYFELKSNGSLSDFNGRRVVVEGVELIHKLQPIETVATAAVFEKVAAVLIVLKIHELTE